jgi:hypothetical protein
MGSAANNRSKRTFPSGLELTPPMAGTSLLTERTKFGAAPIDPIGKITCAYVGFIQIGAIVILI